DSVFDDFARQPLLPNKLSQLGPGVTWLDADNDGRADLLVGTGRGGRPALLRNTGQRFARSNPPGAPNPKDLTTLIPVPDGKGGTMVVGGQASYESATADEAVALPSLVGYPIRGTTMEHAIDVMV